MLHLLWCSPNVIERSEETSFPVPPEVAKRILEDEDLDDLTNIPGPNNSSYCVRCLVWRGREGEGSAHHCSPCQRCVTRFDHHCGVFGRCIVGGNMPCFYGLICMLVCGLVTMVVAR